jgi:hypothetical protein
MPCNSAALIISTLLLPLAFSSAHAQTAATSMDECEKLKIQVAKLKFENANLKKGIIAHSPTSAPPQTTNRATPATSSMPAQTTQHQTVQKVDFALVKCQGNIKAQTVTVTLLLTNAGASRPIQFVKAKAVDTQGEEYKSYDIHVGSGQIRNDLSTGVPVRTVIIIPKVLSSTKTFSLLACPVYDTDVPGQEINVEFRDVAISWK